MRCPKTPSPAETLRVGSSRMCRRMQPEAGVCRGSWTRRGRDLEASPQVRPRNDEAPGRDARGLTHSSVFKLGSLEPECCLLRRAPGSTSCRSGGVRLRAHPHVAGRRHRSVELLSLRSGRPLPGTNSFRARSRARKTISTSSRPARSVGPQPRCPGNRAGCRIRCCRPPPTQDRALGRPRMCPRGKYETPGHTRSLVFTKQVLDTPVGDALPSVEALRVAGQQDLDSFADTLGVDGILGHAAGESCTLQISGSVRLSPAGRRTEVSEVCAWMSR
ncbi:hypothetical protein SAMN05444521_2827 [Streptomyces sp. 3214.6]|nr:hypothetical protein SAMN05444521_2827 [Streptomyces sp. 3214.6]